MRRTNRGRIEPNRTEPRWDRQAFGVVVSRFYLIEGCATIKLDIACDSRHPHSQSIPNYIEVVSRLWISSLRRLRGRMKNLSTCSRFSLVMACTAVSRSLGIDSGSWTVRSLYVESRKSNQRAMAWHRVSVEWKSHARTDAVHKGFRSLSSY